MSSGRTLTFGRRHYLLNEDEYNRIMRKNETSNEFKSSPANSIDVKNAETEFDPTENPYKKRITDTRDKIITNTVDSQLSDKEKLMLSTQQWQKYLDEIKHYQKKDPLLRLIDSIQSSRSNSTNIPMDINDRISDSETDQNIETPIATGSSLKRSTTSRKTGFTIPNLIKASGIKPSTRASREARKMFNTLKSKGKYSERTGRLISGDTVLEHSDLVSILSDKVFPKLLGRSEEDVNKSSAFNKILRDHNLSSSELGRGSLQSSSPLSFRKTRGSTKTSQPYVVGKSGKWTPIS